jgi:hypothetical protein
MFSPLYPIAKGLRGRSPVPTCFRLSRTSVTIFEIAITTTQCNQIVVSALCTSAFKLHALLLGLMVGAPTLH